MRILKAMLSRFVKILNIKSPADIKGCHYLPVRHNSTTDNKHVIVKFVIRKHSKFMLFSKKSINSKRKVWINHMLHPYCCYIWGKCKDLQRISKVSKGFCLGMVVTNRVTGNNPPIKILLKKDLMAIQECSHEV